MVWTVRTFGKNMCCNFWALKQGMVFDVMVTDSYELIGIGTFQPQNGDSLQSFGMNFQAESVGLSENSPGWLRTMGLEQIGNFQDWLVVWLPFFIFPYIGNFIIPIDPSFSEGFFPNHQPEEFWVSYIQKTAGLSQAGSRSEIDEEMGKAALISRLQASEEARLQELSGATSKSLLADRDVDLSVSYELYYIILNYQYCIIYGIGMHIFIIYMYIYI